MKFYHYYYYHMLEENNNFLWNWLSWKFAMCFELDRWRYSNFAFIYRIVGKLMCLLILFLWDY